MDHVDGHDSVGPLYGPVRRGGIQLQWREKIGQPRSCAMSGDAVQGLLVLIGGLPRQVRQRGCEVDRMLTGSTGNLQNHPGSGKKSP
jgi:hypothetical protein